MALTRARKQLLMTGNINTLRQSDVFARLIQFMDERSEIVRPFD